MLKTVLVILMLLFLVGCVFSKPEGIQCKEPRPDMCTMQYAPVCAVRDNQVRCIKAPCESTETKTYSNACKACSDPDVFYYQPGACNNNKSGDFDE